MGSGSGGTETSTQQLTARLNVDAAKRTVLAEHARLRLAVEELLQDCIAFEGGATQGRDLASQLLSLSKHLEAHLFSEHAILVPHLVAAGNEGRKLALELENEHGDQLVNIGLIRTRAESAKAEARTNTQELGRYVRETAARLLQDMEHEESTLLRYLD